jgi:hypothetical protein
MTAHAPRRACGGDRCASPDFRVTLETAANSHSGAISRSTLVLEQVLPDDRARNHQVRLVLAVVATQFLPRRRG